MSRRRRAGLVDADDYRLAVRCNGRRVLVVASSWGVDDVMTVTVSGGQPLYLHGSVLSESSEQAEPTEATPMTVTCPNREHRAGHQLSGERLREVVDLTMTRPGERSTTIDRVSWPNT